MTIRTLKFPNIDNLTPYSDLPTLPNPTQPVNPRPPREPVTQPDPTREPATRQPANLFNYMGWVGLLFPDPPTHDPPT